MNTRTTDRAVRALRALALGAALALASHPLAAMDEVTVNGASEAAQLRAHRALVEADMKAYSETVGSEFKGLVKAELERSMRGDTQLARVETRDRGWLSLLR